MLQGEEFLFSFLLQLHTSSCKEGCLARSHDLRLAMVTKIVVLYGIILFSCVHMYTDGAILEDAKIIVGHSC